MEEVMYQLRHIDSTIQVVIATVIFCGLVSMQQRATLLEFADNKPDQAQRIAALLIDRALTVKCEANWEECLAAKLDRQAMVAKRVVDMRRTSESLNRLALSIKAKTDQATVRQGITYPRAA
jgi:hypothetical protein